MDRRRVSTFSGILSGATEGEEGVVIVKPAVEGRFGFAWHDGSALK